MPTRRAGSACPGAGMPAPRRSRPPTLNPEGYGPVRRGAAAVEPADRLLLRLPDRLARPRPQQRHGAGRGGADRRRRPVRPLRERLPAVRAGLPARHDLDDPPRCSPAAIRRRSSTSLMATCAAAWHHYLEHYNNGRPVVLIGHSQGTIHLVRLIASEIEGRPVAARMLSALLIGFNVEVPAGPGDRRHLPHHAALHAPGPDRLHRHLRLVPRRGAAAAGRAVRPRRRARHDRRLHQSGRAWQRRRRAARQLLVRRLAQQRAGSPGRRPARRRPLSCTRAGLVSAACVHDGPVGYLAVARERRPRATRAPTAFPATSLWALSRRPAGASTWSTSTSRRAI